MDDHELAAAEARLRGADAASAGARMPRTPAAMVAASSSSSHSVGSAGAASAQTGVHPQAQRWQPPRCRPVPSLQELCIRSVCETKLAYCDAMHDIPEHLAVDIVFRIMTKGHLTPMIARKLLTSNSVEIVEFAQSCLENLNSAEIAAGPLTAKGAGRGCRP